MTGRVLAYSYHWLPRYPDHEQHLSASGRAILRVLRNLRWKLWPFVSASRHRTTQFEITRLRHECFLLARELNAKSSAR